MSDSPILPRLLSLAARHADVPEGALRPEADLFEALGIDSLQALDLLTRLEEAFGVEIPDYELQEIRSFAELAELIARRR